MQESQRLLEENSNLCRRDAHNPLSSAGIFAFVLVLLAVFAHPLAALAVHAAGSQLHSHILLVPFISAYLIYIRRDQLPKDRHGSFGWAATFFIAGTAAFAGARWLQASWPGVSDNDYLALMALSFLLLLTAGGFLFLGRRWMAEAAFPVGFLVFMIPLPDAVADSLENASKVASAEAANLFFNLSGTPVLRDGTIFQLPGIVLEVAKECSGIRSSWVLFITSILASNLFLRTTWQRLFLVAFVIPLGVVRNGLRILVIGLLCVEIGPHMIHSVIHRRGGPLFFALSLIPLFAVLWALRKSEAARERKRLAQSTGQS